MRIEPTRLLVSDAYIEATARRIAAQKMGLVKDPMGERLPDDLWRQALSQAMAELGLLEEYEG